MRVIESNMIEGQLSPVAQQIGFIICAFLGAHMGTELVRGCAKGRYDGCASPLSSAIQN